jgi:hypothetical protein
MARNVYLYSADAPCILSPRVIQRLDSAVESEAISAIYAADKICAKSETFAINVCDKLATMMLGNMASCLMMFLDD